MPKLNDSLADELVSKLGDVKEAEKPGEAAAQIARVRQALGALEERVVGRAMGLETFFGEVSRGMIEAQRDLDRESVQYSLGAGQRAMPALFRIPRVNAEFQFGVESSAQRGFNVLLLSSEKSSKETVQHKVSFEVVAVPPPPELVARVGSLPAPTDALSAMLASRLEQVRDDADASESEQQIARTLAACISKALVLRSLGGTLIFLRSDEAGEAQLYLAFLPDDGEVVVTRVPKSAFSKGLQKLVDAVSAAREAALPPVPEQR